MKIKFSSLSPKTAVKTRRWSIAGPRCAARLAVLFGLAAGVWANAQSTNDSDVTDYSTFRIIAERNIFDPNRYPRMHPHHTESHEVPTFSLAGTMSYRKGFFAFFNGTSDDYQKALQEGGRIAGYTVAKINFGGVTLELAGHEIEMKVGVAMQREGNSWQLVAPGGWSGLSAGSQSDTDDTNSSTASPVSVPSGPGSDILKRLMQQREQELK